MRNSDRPTCWARMEDLDVDSVIERLLEVRGSRPGKQVNLAEHEVKALCLKAREIFMSQPVLLELEAPIKICGESRVSLRKCFVFVLVFLRVCRVLANEHWKRRGQPAKACILKNTAEGVRIKVGRAHFGLQGHAVCANGAQHGCDHIAGPKDNSDWTSAGTAARSAQFIRVAVRESLSTFATHVG